MSVTVRIGDADVESTFETMTQIRVKVRLRVGVWARVRIRMKLKVRARVRVRVRRGVRARRTPYTWDTQLVTWA